MRWLRSAICTSGEPVSDSWSRNFVMTPCLTPVSKVISWGPETSRTASISRGELRSTPGPIDATHLAPRNAAVHCRLHAGQRGPGARDTTRSPGDGGARDDVPNGLAAPEDGAQAAQPLSAFCDERRGSDAVGPLPGDGLAPNSDL